MNQKNLEALEKEPLPTLPEVIFLDEQSESLLKKFGKTVKPLQEMAARHSKVAGEKLKENSHKLYDASKKNWHEKYGPKTKTILKQGSSSLGEVFTKTKNSVGPSINKIKDSDGYKKLKVKAVPYSKNPGKFSNALVILSGFLKNLSFLKEARNRKYLYICLIIVFLFAGYFKARSNNIHRTEKREEFEIENSYDQAKEKFNQGKEDIALGKPEGTAKLIDSLSLVTKAKQSESNKEKAIELEKEIKASLDKLTMTTRFYNSEPHAQFGKEVTRVILADQDIYGVGTDGKIYSMNFRDKDSRLVASLGKDSGGVTGISYFSNGGQILLITDIGKIVSFNISSKAVADLQLEDPEAVWEKGRSITTFSSNIYLLDESGSIWKHTKKENVYSKGTSYLNSKGKITNGIDLSIDGNIFSLSSDGQIKKFSRGVEDKDFALKDLPGGQKIETPIKIVTNDETNYIYVLDKSSNKIIKFDKSGAFVSQYVFDDFTAEDFIINEKIKKILGAFQQHHL